MLRVGLTGGIGSGKSTVAALLAEHGFTVIDADAIAREIVEPGEPALEEIAARFGAGILDDQGRLDRASLAAIVFDDADARRELEAITHPRIGQRVQERAEEAASEDPNAVVVLDHPLLVETGQAGNFDVVIVVEAPVEERVRRLVQSRSMPESDARARLAAQASDDVRRRHATHVVVNDADVAVLRKRLEPVVEDLRRRAEKAARGR